MIGIRGCVLLLLCLVHVASIAAFTWSDCGVQLYKDIHYEVASIDPTTINTDKSLSINVVATIADTVYNARTRLMVWKDGELFLDVYIDDLCDIISTTKGLSCPLPVGEISFTYKFEDVPLVSSGEYVVNVKSETPEGEIGCIEFIGMVEGAKDDDCLYESSFEVRFMGDAFYTSGITNRTTGDYIQVGPLGQLGASHGYGTFVDNFVGTPDLGGTTDTRPYKWTLNGTLVNRQTIAANHYVDDYHGDFYIFYQNGAVYEPAFQGRFNWTITTEGSKETVQGIMWFNPTYQLLEYFNWPVVIGNLGPFEIDTTLNGVFVARGSKSYCTCGFDACGVCGGKGESCGLGEIDDDNGWGDRKIVAVFFGIFGFFVLLGVAELSRRIHRQRRRIPNDDADLLDHPEKPDYGTMAIDDVIREGERV